MLSFPFGSFSSYADAELTGMIIFGLRKVGKCCRVQGLTNLWQKRKEKKEEIMELKNLEEWSKSMPDEQG